MLSLYAAASLSETVRPSAAFSASRVDLVSLAAGHALVRLSAGAVGLVLGVLGMEVAHRIVAHRVLLGDETCLLLIRCPQLPATNRGHLKAITNILVVASPIHRAHLVQF